ncbi:MAG: hypothetical protein K2V38_27540 [Gemmataceae bacterium]|nr:hypothetical protein [Gemmataceae bacterium]
MRSRTLALTLLALVALASAGAAQDTELKPHTSTAGKYKAAFPGTVKTAVTEVPAGKDKLKLTLDVVELKGDISFTVGYVDVSPEVAKLPPGPRLEKVRDGNKGPNGKIVSDTEITLRSGDEKFPGRDVLIETPGGHIRNRMVIVGPRLYQVVVQGSKDVVTSPTADKFINSFEITP